MCLRRVGAKNLDHWIQILVLFARGFGHWIQVLQLFRRNFDDLIQMGRSLCFSACGVSAHSAFLSIRRIRRLRRFGVSAPVSPCRVLLRLVASQA